MEINILHSNTLLSKSNQKHHPTKLRTFRSSFYPLNNEEVQRDQNLQQCHKKGRRHHIPADEFEKCIDTNFENNDRTINEADISTILSNSIKKSNK